MNRHALFLLACIHPLMSKRLKKFIHLHHGSFGSSVQAAQCIRAKIKCARLFYLTRWLWIHYLSIRVYKTLKWQLFESKLRQIILHADGQILFVVNDPTRNQQSCHLVTFYLGEVKRERGRRFFERRNIFSSVLAFRLCKHFCLLFCKMAIARISSLKQVLGGTTESFGPASQVL